MINILIDLGLTGKNYFNCLNLFVFCCKLIHKGKF